MGQPSCRASSGDSACGGPVGEGDDMGAQGRSLVARPDCLLEQVHWTYGMTEPWSQVVVETRVE